jgi:hypothetical protein
VHRIPEAVAAAELEFCDAGLANNTRSPGTIVVGFSSKSSSTGAPVAKNGRPEPKTTGTWLTGTGPARVRNVGVDQA